MSKPKQTPDMDQLVDEFRNIHYLSEELARGGQGVVFRTRDADLAIKQPLDALCHPDRNANLRERFLNVRLLPLPPRIPISLPLAILRDEPGYVMRLLNGMKPFSVFDLNGKSKKELVETKPELPHWLAGIPDKNMAMRLLYYAETGSTRHRLSALAKCASILARLHSAGIVYGDISMNNAFVAEGASGEVWLIDADNLRAEVPKSHNSVYTSGFGAPEVVQGGDCSRPRTDCWSFAVLAFKILADCHPFMGKKEQNPEANNDAWSADPLVSGKPADLDKQIAAGFLPFIDDNNDDSNCALTCPPLPRELVATSKLRLLFEETFCAGRTQPHRRPAMFFWALELAKAFDLSLECIHCKMSYFADNNETCPYCAAARPAFLRARTHRWEIVIPRHATEFTLPHRLFHPFSLEHHGDVAYEAVPDFLAKAVFPVRGTKPFPDNLSFEFVEEAK